MSKSFAVRVILIGALVLTGCSDWLWPEPCARGCVALEAESAEVREGESAELPVAITDTSGATLEGELEWLVRDSAVAEVFGPPSPGDGAATIFGSSAGVTWVVVRSGSSSDSVRVTVAAASPLGPNEAMIETEGRFTRRYRVPIRQAILRDRLLDPREEGTVSIIGDLEELPFADADHITSGFWVALRDRPLEEGTLELTAPGDDAPHFAYVYPQLAWWTHVGPLGPHHRVFRSDAGGTFTVESIEVRPTAAPVASGTIVMDAARAYQWDYLDIHRVWVDTGRRHDVRVRFNAEIAPQPVAGARMRVLEGPASGTASTDQAYLFAQGDSVRLNFQSFGNDLPVFLQLQHDDYIVGSWSLGTDGDGPRVIGKWGPGNDPDHLNFRATTGTFEITEYREPQRGYPGIFRGSLTARGPLEKADGAVVDSLSVRVEEFAIADSLWYEF